MEYVLGTVSCHLITADGKKQPYLVIIPLTPICQITTKLQLFIFHSFICNVITLKIIVSNLSYFAWDIQSVFQHYDLHKKCKNVDLFKLIWRSRSSWSCSPSQSGSGQPGMDIKPRTSQMSHKMFHRDKNKSEEIVSNLMLIALLFLFTEFFSE